MDEGMNVAVRVPAEWVAVCRAVLAERLGAVPCCTCAVAAAEPNAVDARAPAAHLAGRALVAAADAAWARCPAASRPPVRTACRCTGVGACATAAAGTLRGVLGWIVVWRAHGTTAHRIVATDPALRAPDAAARLFAEAVCAVCTGTFPAVLHATCCSIVSSISGGGGGDIVRGAHLARCSFAAAAGAVAAGTAPFCVLRTDGTVRLGPCEPEAAATGLPRVETMTVLPGSFNPCHAGHRALLAAVQRMQGPRAPAPHAELALVNADKPALGVAPALARAAQFAGAWPVVLSRLPLFVQKARAYARIAHRVVFVVGFDTMRRVLEPRYYGGSAAAAAAALAELRALGACFLVAGRVDHGRYRSIATERATLPPHFAQYQDLFRDIPEAVFRLDVSSTQVREQLKVQGQQQEQKEK